VTETRPRGWFARRLERLTADDHTIDAEELRDHAVDASRALIERWVDPTLREWAAQTVVGYLVEATLNWLEYGDPTRDAEFVQLSTAAVRVAISTWSR